MFLALYSQKAAIAEKTLVKLIFENETESNKQITMFTQNNFSRRGSNCIQIGKSEGEKSPRTRICIFKPD